MTDEDTDFDDPFSDLEDDADDSDPKGEEGDGSSDAADSAKDKSKPARPAPGTKPTVDPTLEALAAMGLTKLKEDWIATARAEGVVAVDFDSIPMEGLDEAARDKFVATAKAAEASERARLEAMGFVYSPGQSAAEAAAAAEDSKDAAAAIAWGIGGPITIPATGKQENDKAIAEAAQRGDVRGVIGNLSGLGDFFMKGKRDA